MLHTDSSVLPGAVRARACWNYRMTSCHQPGQPAVVTYWMNRLQALPGRQQLFVTLNPIRPPRPDAIVRSEVYLHPIFDAAAIRAQERLWSLQGRFNTWYCGAYFGAGFHEDGLQAGLAAAEALGGVRRPWADAGDCGPIGITHSPWARRALETAA